MARNTFQQPTLEELKRGGWSYRYRPPEIGKNGLAKRQIRGRITLAEAKNKKEALRVLQERMASINSGHFQPLRTGKTFADFAEDYDRIVISKHKGSNQARVRSVMRTHYKPFFGEMLMKEIDLLAVQRFVSQLTVAPITVRHIAQDLCTMLKRARKWHYTSHRVDYEDLTVPTVEEKEQPYFTEQQMRLMVQEGGDYRILYWLEMETGMRIGEALGARIENVDTSYNPPRISVVQSSWNRKLQDPKTKNSIRNFRISRELAEALRFQAGQSQGLIFHYPDGSAWGYTKVKDAFTALLDKLMIRVYDSKFHAFRHGQATIMEERNMPWTTRKNRLGHGSERMTKRYTHTPNDNEDIALAEYFGQTMKQMVPVTEVVQ